MEDLKLPKGLEDDDDLILELIYETMNLMNDNMRLIQENERLKERVKALESFNRLFLTKPLGTEPSECAIMVVKKIIET